MKSKIGILGGSFNPIHKAHISLATYFLENYDADKVIFVPCNVSPFKTNEKVASNKHRYEMVKIAVNDNPNFEISNFEINKDTISYTFQTIDYFKCKYPTSELCLLIGGDQAENFHKWKNWKHILDNVEIFVALRKGYKIPTYEFESYKKATYMEMPYIEISASIIREQMSNSENNIKFLDNDVEKYIIKNNIY